jgi:hypothetical protein
MTAFLREEVERHSRPATADAGEPAASPAPAPGGGSEEASADPHYAPRVVELGLRRLPSGLGGAGGSNVVFDWPPGDRFDGWAVDGAARRAPGHVLRRRARDPNPPPARRRDGGARDVHVRRGRVARVRLRGRPRAGQGRAQAARRHDLQGRLRRRRHARAGRAPRERRDLQGRLRREHVPRQGQAHVPVRRHVQRRLRETRLPRQGRLRVAERQEVRGPLQRGPAHGRRRLHLDRGPEVHGGLRQRPPRGPRRARFGAPATPRRPAAADPRARARRLAGAYGQHYEGEWEDGEPHGAGVFTSSNSEYVEGDFHRGRYVDPDKEDASPTSGLGSLFGGGSASSKHHLP